MNHMSVADYRRDIVEPALAEEKADRDFTEKVMDDKKPRIPGNRLGLLKNGFFWRENSWAASNYRQVRN